MKLYLPLIVLCFLSFQTINAQENLPTNKKTETKTEVVYPVYVVMFQGESYETNNINILKLIDFDDIESVSVLKNENAVEKYGEKGKDDVVEIFLKNNEKTDDLFKRFIGEGC